MEEENDRDDNLDISNDNPSSALKITYNPGILRCILSKMNFDELLKARLVCNIWKDEAEFFIRRKIKGIDFTSDSQLKKFFKLQETLRGHDTLIFNWTFSLFYTLKMIRKNLLQLGAKLSSDEFSCLQNIKKRQIKNLRVMTAECPLLELSFIPINPPINLDLKTISAGILATCDLGGTKELLLKGFAPRRSNQQRAWQYMRYLLLGMPALPLVADWSEAWSVKEKISNLLQQRNNVNSLELHFNFPVKFTNTEADFVRNFVNLYTLSIKFSCCRNFGPNDIGTILVNRCPTLNYLNIKVKKNSRWRSFLPLLVRMLNERKNNGYSNLTVSILPMLYVFHTNSNEFMELANIGPQFESLEVMIDCTTPFRIGIGPNQNDLIQLFQAVHTLLRNTAGCLKELKLEFRNMNGDYLRRRAFGLRLNIPCLPKVQNVLLYGFPGGRTSQYIQFH